VTRPENADRTTSETDESAHDHPSGNGAAPWQRQHNTRGEVDPTTVKLQVGAPEHAGGVAVRDQADSASTEGPFGSAPSTVRIGGRTSPERVPPVAAGGGASSVRVPRRTNLQLKRLDPWSVLKLSLVLSVAGFMVWLVAVGVLYGVLAGMGVWDQLNGAYVDLTSASNNQASTELISGGRVFGTAFVIGLVNIVLMTALATVGSLVYNVAADFVGGVEVTLSEPD
jgi:Transmembrane domain of unknown function (DUF3566)